MINIFKKKITKSQWVKIYWNKTEAKNALQNLSVPDHSGKLRKVTFVELENGKRIPINEVTEEQAHEFMKAICPEWAFK